MSAFHAYKYSTGVNNVQHKIQCMHQCLNIMIVHTLDNHTVTAAHSSMVLTLSGAHARAHTHTHTHTRMHARTHSLWQYNIRLSDPWNLH